MCVFVARLPLVLRLYLSEPPAHLRTQRGLMLAPWVQCCTSRESLPRTSILHTRKANIFGDFRICVYRINAFGVFWIFTFLSGTGPAQRVTPAVTRLTVYRWLLIFATSRTFGYKTNGFSTF